MEDNGVTNTLKFTDLVTYTYQDPRMYDAFFTTPDLVTYMKYVIFYFTSSF